MKIAVIGCGGIGGVVAGVLAVGKQNVCGVELSGKTRGVLRDQGLRLEGKKGSYHAKKMQVFSRISDTGERFDVIIIAVKSDALASVFIEAKKKLCRGGFILTLQNGIEIIDLAERHPEVKIIAGAVGYNAQMVELGRYRVTSQGGVTVGNLTCATEDDIFLLKGIFEPLIAVDITRNTTGVLWAKLLVVCAVTGLGGATGLLLGELLKQRISRKLFYRIVTEGALVARAREIRIERFAGGVNPEKFADLRGGYPLPLRWLILNLVGMKYRDLKSNIHHSLEMGQKTEIDYLNGKIQRIGKDLGIKTPVNGKLTQIVKEIEEGKRSMHPNNLFEIWNETMEPPRDH
jgi:2-dehydropantoate 2-reductase